MENIEKIKAKNLSLEEIQSRKRPDNWFDNATGFDDLLPAEESQQKNVKKHGTIRRWLSLDELNTSKAHTPDEAAHIEGRNNATSTEKEDVQWLKKSRISDDDKKYFNSYSVEKDEEYTPRKKMHTISTVAITIAVLAMIFTTLIMYSIQGGMFVHFTWVKGISSAILMAVSIPLFHSLITSNYNKGDSRALSWIGSVFLALASAMVIYSTITLFTPQESVEYTPEENSQQQEQG